MMEYIALAAISILVFAFVLQPLIGAGHRAPSEMPARVTDLRARRHYIMQAIRDVDFDYDSGKVSEEVYQETRSRFIREAAMVMSELEQETGNSDPTFDQEIRQLRDRARSERSGESPTDQPLQSS